MKQSNLYRHNKPKSVLQPGTFLSGIGFNGKKNLRWAGYMAAYFFLLGIIISYCYPYMDMTTDTDGYIHWAIEDLYGGPRPLGYSHFMSFVHDIGHSTHFLFWSQFILFAATTIFNFYVVLYVCAIREHYLKWTWFILNLGFISGIYTTNLAMSDNLFYCLSILLLSVGLCFIKKPSIILFVIMLVLMQYCIKVRYLGLVYPIPVILLFILSRISSLQKIIASLLVAGITFGYVTYVKEKTDEDLGVNIFSAFGGWQMANNALHVVPHLNLNKPLVQTDDDDLLMVDTLVRVSYAACKNKYPGPNEVSFNFIWSDSLPLRPILKYWRLRHKTVSYYGAWNEMGGIYNSYGSLLMRSYPGLFFRYYLLNNARYALLPPNELFEKYTSTGKPGLYERNWFDLNMTDEIKPRQDIFRGLLVVNRFVYPALWALFFAAAGIYLSRIKKMLKQSPMIFNFATFLFIFITVYTLASIFAAPINLRFMMFVRTAILMFVLIMAQNYTLSKKA